MPKADAFPTSRRDRLSEPYPAFMGNLPHLFYTRHAIELQVVNVV